MLSISSTTTPKRRQTCDACRAAKIKCDKRTPICGRCLASGHLCGYGISRQGAWWRQKGSRKAVQEQTTEQDEMNALHSGNSSTLQQDYSSVASLLSARPLDTRNLCKEADKEYEMDLQFLGLQGDYKVEDFQNSLQTPPRSAELTPNRQLPDNMRHSSGSRAGTKWPSISTDSEIESHGFLPQEGCTDVFRLQPRSQNTSPEDSHFDQDRECGQSTCSCYATVLQALQALEDSFPAADVFKQSSSSAGVAAIMQHNERTLQCCLTIIRCQKCREDHRRSPIVLLLTLISREIALTEEWANAAEPQAPNNSSYLQSMTSERSLRIEVAQVGTRRLSDMLMAIRQICQSLKCDFTRLAHNILVESMMINLRNTSARLNLETSRATTAMQL